MRVNKYLGYALLMPLPILLVLLSQWNLSARGPYYERQNYDPDYQYLLNALNLLEGHAPGHVDHPGTTVQLLIAALIGLRQEFHPGPAAGVPVRQDVLLHPEEYLHAVQNVFLVLVVVLYLLIAVQLYRRTGLLWTAIGLELFALLSRNGVHALVRVSPEPVLIAVVLIATGLLATTLAHEPVEYPAWQPLLLGTVLGIGLVTKLTFLPLLLLILWFPHWRERLMALATCVISVLLLTIPIWGHAARVFDWIAGLISNQGRYGTGPSGLLPSFPTFMDHVTALVWEEPFYSAMLAMLVTAWLVRRRSRDSQARLDRMRIAVMLGILLVQLVIVAKYGTAHYLVPGLAFLGTAYVVLILRLHPEVSARRGWNVALPAILLIVLALVAVRYTAAFVRSVAGDIRLHQDTLLLDARMDAEYPECTVVPFYGATDARYALDLANDFASGRFAETLKAMYPDAIQYNIWIPRFGRFGTTVPHNEIQARLDRGDCILLRGGHFLPTSNESNYDRRLDLEEVITQEKEVVYRLKGILP